MRREVVIEPSTVFDGEHLVGLVHQERDGQWLALTVRGESLGRFTSARAASNALFERHQVVREETT